MTDESAGMTKVCAGMTTMGALEPNSQLHPLVPPQVSHFRHVPLRTSVKLPHSPQASALYAGFENEAGFVAFGESGQRGAGGGRRGENLPGRRRSAEAARLWWQIIGR